MSLVCQYTVKAILKSSDSPLTKNQYGELEKMAKDMVDAAVEVAAEEFDGANIENIAVYIESKVRRMVKIGRDKFKKFTVKVVTRSILESIKNRIKSRLKTAALKSADPNPLLYPVTELDDQGIPHIKISGNVSMDQLDILRKREYQANKSRSKNTSEKWKMIYSAAAA